MLGGKHAATRGSLNDCDFDFADVAGEGACDNHLIAVCIGTSPETVLVPAPPSPYLTELLLDKEFKPPFVLGGGTYAALRFIKRWHELPDGAERTAFTIAELALSPAAAAANAASAPSTSTSRRFVPPPAAAAVETAATTPFVVAAHNGGTQADAKYLLQVLETAHRLRFNELFCVCAPLFSPFVRSLGIEYPLKFDGLEVTANRLFKALYGRGRTPMLDAELKEREYFFSGHAWAGMGASDLAHSAAPHVAANTARATAAINDAAYTCTIDPFEAPSWENDDGVSTCPDCKSAFRWLGVPILRQSHCRCCGRVKCAECAKWRVDRALAPLRRDTDGQLCKACKGCYDKVETLLRDAFLSHTFAVSGLSVLEIGLMQLVDKTWCAAAQMCLHYFRQAFYEPTWLAAIASGASIAGGGSGAGGAGSAGAAAAASGGAGSGGSGLGGGVSGGSGPILQNSVLQRAPSSTMARQPASGASQGGAGATVYNGTVAGPSPSGFTGGSAPATPAAQAINPLVRHILRSSARLLAGHCPAILSLLVVTDFNNPEEAAIVCQVLRETEDIRRSDVAAATTAQKQHGSASGVGCGVGCDARPTRRPALHWHMLCTRWCTTPLYEFFGVQALQALQTAPMNDKTKEARGLAAGFILAGRDNMLVMSAVIPLLLDFLHAAPLLRSETRVLIRDVVVIGRNRSLLMLLYRELCARKKSDDPTLFFHLDLLRADVERTDVFGTDELQRLSAFLAVLDGIGSTTDSYAQRELWNQLRAFGLTEEVSTPTRAASMVVGPAAVGTTRGFSSVPTVTTVDALPDFVQLKPMPWVFDPDVEIRGLYLTKVQLMQSQQKPMLVPLGGHRPPKSMTSSGTSPSPNEALVTSPACSPSSPGLPPPSPVSFVATGAGAVVATPSSSAPPSVVLAPAALSPSLTQQREASCTLEADSGPVLEEYAILYKKEDLRGDYVVCNAIAIMEALLRQKGVLTKLARIPRYRVLPIGPNSGIIEKVPGAKSVEKLREMDCEAGSREKPIETFLSKLPSRSDAMRHTFTQSAAFYIMVTYLLGIGDRHQGNVMMCEDGGLLHVDFGFVLDAKPTVEQMTARYVRFDEDLKSSIQAWYPDKNVQERVAKFLSLTGDCFVAVRPHADVIFLILQHLCVHRATSKPPSEIFDFIFQRMVVGWKDVDAKNVFVSRVKDSMGNPNLQDRLHESMQQLKAKGVFAVWDLFFGK